MNRYKELNIEGYEKVVQCDNSSVGFRAWIAIHSTTLGPALGGCRLWKYGEEEEAVVDVLRLSRGMTYKNSLAGLWFGGGKSVVDADPESIDREELFPALGEFVETLGGDYITAEDVNTTLSDMEIVKQHTDHVATVGASGNPSPFTALGVYHAILAAVKYRYQRHDLQGLTVAVQGVGETGGRLAERLYQNGCQLIIADVNEKNIFRLRQRIPFTVVGPEEIYAVPCDVFSPCALGGILNSETIPELQCAIVCGSANNQLLHEDDGEKLRERQILYGPDYAVNAGGVINISCEIGQRYETFRAEKRVKEIGNTVTMIFEESERQRIATNIVANSLAEKRIADALEKKIPEYI